MQSQKARLIFYDLAPFSVNSTYRRSQFGGVAKTSAATDWCYEFFYKLNWEPNQAALKHIRDNFDEKLHGLHIDITILVPKEELFNKKGKLSSRTLDLTNVEKIMVDCLCLPKFHELALPEGAPNLNVDDKSVLEVRSRKVIAAKRRGLIIEVQIVPLDAILNLNIENY